MKLTNERDKISNSKDLFSIPLIHGKAHFILQTGTIIEAQRERNEETEASGGGTIYRGSNPIYLSSSTRTNLSDDFWLLTDNGREIHYTFKNINFPTRPGHRVTVIILQTPPILELNKFFLIKRIKKEYVLFIWNQTTKNSLSLATSFDPSPVGKILLTGILLCSLIPLIWILTLLGKSQLEIQIIILVWTLVYELGWTYVLMSGKKIIRRKLKKVRQFLSAT